MFAYLAQFLPFVVGQKGPEALEAGVDALHPPSFVGVGDFTADPTLLVHSFALAADDGAKATLAHDDTAFPDRPIDPDVTKTFKTREVKKGGSHFLRNSVEASKGARFSMTNCDALKGRLSPAYMHRGRLTLDDSPHVILVDGRIHRDVIFDVFLGECVALCRIYRPAEENARSNCAL